MRNKQLTSFTNDFQSHQEGYRAENDKVLILGDFNVSPRSAYYKDLETQLGS
jgi:endonuclease/exonuclease/phosphatase family metal-dependent hydrolase